MKGGYLVGCCKTNTLTACATKQFVQDKVCGEWAGVGPGEAGTEVVLIYETNIPSLLSLSGYVSLAGSATANVSLQLLDADGNPVETIVLVPGNTASFTGKGVQSVQVDLSGLDGNYTGEFCITCRYSIR